MTAPTRIDVFAPNAFILQGDGTAYDLLSANVSTGVVTSSFLPSATTNFLTSRLQKLLTLLPSLSAAALKVLIRNLVTLDQLEGTFTATVTATGSDYALGLSSLGSPTSNLQVTIPFSMSSPFTSDGSAVVMPASSPMAFTFATLSTGSSGETIYMSVGGYGNVTGEDQYIAMPVDGEVSRLQIKLSTNCAPVTGTVTFTVRKNSVDTTMVITIQCVVANNTEYYITTVANPVSVVIGDVISIKVVNAAVNAPMTSIIGVITITPS